MARTTHILNDHLLAFGEQSEAWKEDHDEAMACVGLEEVIAYGNFIYDRILNIDAEWSAEMENAGAEPAEADAKAVEALYSEWLGKARPNLKCAEEFATAGYAVKGADRLREACREVEGILSVSVERLRRAARNVREGRTRPLAEVRDELLRRFGSGSRG